MSRKVIIVESPNKAKTIRAIVGRAYDVVATVGHFCDLPTKELGVDVENGFKPTYVYDPDKKQVIAQLKALKERFSPDDIVVASDADREGEAIGWHIARTIGLKPAQVKRAEFHEITEPGIKRALAAVRPLDLGLVAAQEARRILDRLVGYTVSPVVRDRLPDEADLSAGRVQSVALRVVVDRERAIRDFKPTEYWSVHAVYPWPAGQRGPKTWESEYLGTGAPGKLKAAAIATEADAQAIAQAVNGPHRLARLSRKESQRKPPAPFITSTMLARASARLKMSTDETTRHAKTLFERGLVTYIRTDSPAVSPEFQRETLSYLRQRYGEHVVPARPNQYKAKGAANAQGAHECIRPTKLELERPEGLEPRAQALFQLIRETYLASQCKPARYDVTEAFLTKEQHVLKATGRVLVEPGFLAIFAEADEPDEPGEGDAESKALPALAEGETHTPKAINPKQHWTKPPERFTEASLIKYLEAKGIGRPSTFNAMVAKIRQRHFVTVINKRFLQPTPKGEKLDAELRAWFSPVINEGFTADLEQHLDAIAAREEEWRAYMARFWGELTPLLDAARAGTTPRARGRRSNADGASRAGGSGGGEVHDPNAPACPKCQQGFTKRIHSAKTGKDYYVCGRDSRERTVCGFIMGVEDVANPPCPACGAPTRRISDTLSVCVLSEKGGGGCAGRLEAAPDLSGNPACYRCGSGMKLVASKKAYRCSVDACNTWLDQDYQLNALCPMCQGPTRRVEGKGYGCVKWRKEGGPGACNGWVKWEEWTPPKKAASKRATAPKKPSTPKKPTTKRKPRAD